MAIPFRALTAFAHVHSVPRSIVWYESIGFTVRNTVVPEGETEPVWASLESGGAELMIAQADEPVDAGQQAVLFYLYIDDVRAKHAELTAAGLAPGPVELRFYAPRGEFRLTDPDGYVLMVTHT